ncbi:MAG: rhodanese-like domain-containing protein [Gammaproteobacteria bacterium]|nr:rhodanese-like domain-containing protein [Gammaproteobacteria bacterium]
MKKIILIFLSNLLLLSFTGVCAEISPEDLDKQFPNRKFYPQLDYVTTKQMLEAVSKEQYNVIDARPDLAYNTLHIKGAIHLSSGDKQFISKIMKIVNSNNKPIVFYCGGLACVKSYKASVKTIDELLKRSIVRKVYTYDSGISSFAYANPDWVLKNGKEISADNPLLDKEKIKKHAKNAEEFTRLINNDDQNQYVILDIREKKQKILNKLFMFKKEKKITLLQPEKLIVFLNKQKMNGKTLMVYGSVEKQIESLYPLIEASGIKKWFYLEGGEIAYSQYMIEKHVSK